MEAKIQLVADALHALFNISSEDGSRDQAEYLLSITDDGDVREWLVDGLGLNEEDEEENIREFIDTLVNIRSSNTVRVNRQHPVKNATKPTTAPAAATKSDPVERAEDTFFHAPVVKKPTPAPIRPNIVREKCYCLCKVEIGGHELLGNCLACGRIVCEAEDYGACLVCKTDAHMHWLPQKNDNEQIDHNNSAIAHKNRLIQYDREGTRRTKVYDDSTDWFGEAGSVWRGREERDEAHRLAQEAEEKKRLARTEMRVELDFTTGQFKVQDKREALDAADTSMREQLQDWIDNPSEFASGNIRKVEQPLPVGIVNVLDPVSEALLAQVREKLGIADVWNPEKSISLFSALDEN